MKRMRFWWWIAPALLCGPLHGGAQTGFYINDEKPQVEIPFEYVNNFIVLNIVVQGRLPLRFIYDTGAEHTLICQKEIGAMLNLQYEREFRVKGTDMETELTAYLVRRMRLDLPGKAHAPAEDLLIMEDNFFRFEEYAGIQINGILAGKVFSRYLIQINYERRSITLMLRSEFKNKPGEYEELPIELFRNKVYIQAAISVSTQEEASVKLLVDTGAGLPLLLFDDTHPLLKPPEHVIPNNIAMGLGGYLTGFVGRTQRVGIGAQEQRDVVTFFQSIDSLKYLEYMNGRNGLIGNVLLSRYIVVLDYLGSRLLLKPTRHYNRRFNYDRSGLSLYASSPYLNRYFVQKVMPGSPAAEAGIQSGDEILRVGILGANVYTLDELQRKLSNPRVKRLKLTIRRGDQKIRLLLTLRDLI